MVEAALLGIAQSVLGQLSSPALKEVCLFFSKSNHLGFVLKTAHHVKDIRERVDGIAKDMSQFNLISRRVEEKPSIRLLDRKETHSFVKVEGVIGRDQAKEEIVKLLLPEEISQHNLSVISIIGFRGLGKTTLAQLVYNDERVQRGFDMCLWACINYLSDLKEVLVTILASVLKSRPHDNNLDQLQRELRKNIEWKRYLLVLDDVWDEDVSNWRELKPLLECGKSGSKVLVTTRKTKVAQCLDATKPYYHLNVLSKESAWSLFVKTAFEEGGVLVDDSELVPLGHQIVHMCVYVLLALIVVGSMLRYKEKEAKLWLSLVDKELSRVLLDDNDDKIMKILMISYNDLPPALKHCFAYCSIFPKDYTFDKDDLIHMWLAQGFVEPCGNKSLEEVGDEYFSYMVDRCFFQEVKRDARAGISVSIGYNYKMHDLMHDLAIQVAGVESKCLFQGDYENMEEKATLRHISINFVFDTCGMSSQSKTLRSLVFHDREGVKTNSLTLLLASFKTLRVLKLPYLYIDKLPDSIGELVHLRYLDLSNNRELVALPNSICGLHNLQTLKLEECWQLKTLPSNIGKLARLRHLFLYGCIKLESLPSELATLTSLVTLDQLIVHQSNDGLRYLGSLDNLCGVVRVDLPAKGWPN